MSMWKKIKQPVCYIAFLAGILILELAAVELLMRAGYFAPKFQCGAVRFKFDRDLLFKVIPYDGMQFNSLGYRDREFQAKKGDKKRILFLGDSFVLGRDVGFSESIPKVLERMMGESCEVYNMGVESYGPDQSLIALEKEGLKYKPDVVILGIFAANDFNDVFRNRIFTTENNRFSRSTSNIVVANLPPLDILYLAKYMLSRWKLIDADFEYVFRLLFLDFYDLSLVRDVRSKQSVRKIELMRGVLKEFKKILSKRGIQFLVVIIPSYENVVDDTFFREAGFGPSSYFTNEDAVARLCLEESIDHINLSPFFLASERREELFDQRAHHLSSEGSSYVAELIRSKLTLGLPQEKSTSRPPASSF